jgi:hypothetical protein
MSAVLAKPYISENEYLEIEQHIDFQINNFQKV